MSRGVAMKKFGPTLKDFVKLRWPEPRRRAKRIDGEVVYVDRFCNAITNIEEKALAGLGKGGAEVFADGKRLCAVGGFYQSVLKGKAIAVVGSSGFLELAVNSGSAADRLGLRIGSAVSLRRAAGRFGY